MLTVCRVLYHPRTLSAHHQSRLLGTSATVALIRELREKTNAGLGDCKKALEASGGDIPEAIAWLRKKGVASASKLSSRLSADGLIATTVSDHGAFLVEINTETDFVARSEKFQHFAREVVELAQAFPAASASRDPLTGAHTIPIEELLRMSISDPTLPQSAPTPLSDVLKTVAATFGENVVLTRAVRVGGKGDVVGHYVHNQLAPGIGTMAAAVALHAPDASGEQIAALQGIAESLSMHCVGSATRYLSIDSCQGEEADKERAVHLETAQKSGKPQHILDKMVNGKMRKFYEEYVLLEQKSLVDQGNPKIENVLNSHAKALSLPSIAAVAFARYKCGELSTAQDAE